MPPRTRGTSSNQWSSSNQRPSSSQQASSTQRTTSNQQDSTNETSTTSTTTSQHQSSGSNTQSQSASDFPWTISSTSVQPVPTGTLAEQYQNYQYLNHHRLLRNTHQGIANALGGGQSAPGATVVPRQFRQQMYNRMLSDMEVENQRRMGEAPEQSHSTSSDEDVPLMSLTNVRRAQRREEEPQSPPLRGASSGEEDEPPIPQVRGDSVGLVDSSDDDNDWDPPRRMPPNNCRWQPVNYDTPDSDEQHSASASGRPLGEYT